MDSAEGSYGQLFDHFGSKEKVDEIIRKTNFVFITHMHGDHQFGILKIIYERDQLTTEFNDDDKMYVIVPSTMMTWLQLFVDDSLNWPDMVVLIPSKNLNPENSYYYQDQ